MYLLIATMQKALNTFKSSQWFLLSACEVRASRLLYHSITLPPRPKLLSLLYQFSILTRNTEVLCDMQ